MKNFIPQFTSSFAPVKVLCVLQVVERECSLLEIADLAKVSLENAQSILDYLEKQHSVTLVCYGSRSMYRLSLSVEEEESLFRIRKAMTKKRLSSRAKTYSFTSVNNVSETGDDRGIDL